MLRLFKEFIKTFINDIIVFSYILLEYLRYLRQIFKLFYNKRVSLSLIKFFINYSSIILLDQRVNNLEISIS